MTIKQKTGRILVALATTAMVVTCVAPAASANSNSDSYPYPGGDQLQSNVWITSFADFFSNCGDWATSAKLLGTNPPTAEWIKDTVNLHANGIGASISGANLSGNGSDLTESWTNDNAWISDLSGSVCANWLTWYVGASSTATSFVPRYGPPRSVSVSV